MKYIKVEWKHKDSDYPVAIYSELDEGSWEVRKVEVFPDGRYGYASGTESAGSTALGETPIPPLSEIASDPQFRPIEIAKQEFEEVWSKRRTAPKERPPGQ